MKTRVVRSPLAKWALAVTGICVVALLPAVFGGGDRIGAGPGDILAFWASSRALLDGLNPYDPAVLQEILGQVNSAFTNAPEVYYPPWLFTLVWWFGLLPAYTFASLWLAVSLVAMVVAGVVMIRYFQREAYADPAGSAQPTKRLEVLFLLTFYPFFVAVDLGQLTPIVLIGLVTYVVTRRRRAPRWQVASGLGLALAAFKPHLIYLVYVDFVIQAVRRRNWAALGALGGGFALMCLAPLVFAPEVYTAFANHDTGATNFWLTPTAGTVLRTALAPGSTFFWLLPTAAGLVAVALFSWRVPVPTEAVASDGRLMVLIAASVITAPYAWTYDFMVLLPVGLFILARAGRFRALAGVPAPTLALLMCNLILIGGTYRMRYHVWYPMAVLILVLVAVWPRSKLPKQLLEATA